MTLIYNVNDDFLQDFCNDTNIRQNLHHAQGYQHYITQPIYDRNSDIKRTKCQYSVYITALHPRPLPLPLCSVQFVAPLTLSKYSLDRPTE